jgi:hypothetical protein
LRVCWGRPQTPPCSATSARRQPAQMCAPVCCSRETDHRSDVHTSKAKPSCVGGDSSAASIAARSPASACTGRPERGASASAPTPPAAKRANQCATVSTARPLQRAMRSTSSPSAAALTISRPLAHPPRQIRASQLPLHVLPLLPAHRAAHGSAPPARAEAPCSRVLAAYSLSGQLFQRILRRAA